MIKLLHEAFTAAGLNLYLRPYGCLPTGYECGIIEVRETEVYLPLQLVLVVVMTRLSDFHMLAYT